MRWNSIRSFLIPESCAANYNNRISKGKIEQIVRACCKQRYAKHDIETIFYEHGDINDLLVLHLDTRFQNALFAWLYSLPFELTRELAIRYGKEDINPFVNTWTDSFVNLGGESFPTFRFSNTDVLRQIQSRGATAETWSTCSGQGDKCTEIRSP